MHGPGGHCAKCNKPGTERQMHILIYTWKIKQTYRNKKCRPVCKGLEREMSGGIRNKDTRRINVMFS